MTDTNDLILAAERIARAIEQRDVTSLAATLADGFQHRTPGGPSSNAQQFLDGIAGIPGEILFVRLAEMQVDETDAGALVTGVQHAQVRIDDVVHDDHRAFADWFVRQGGQWLLRVAVDMPLVS
jgi:hypothetical protein